MKRIAVSVLLLLAALSLAALGGCKRSTSWSVKEPNQQLNVDPVMLPSGMVDLVIKYTITNVDSAPVTFEFSSGKQWDAWVTCNGKELFRESRGKVYTQALTKLTLATGECREFTTTWRFDPKSPPGGKDCKYEIHSGLETAKLKPLVITGFAGPKIQSVD